MKNKQEYKKEKIISQLRAIVGDTNVLTGDNVKSRMIHVWYNKPIDALCIVRPSTTQQVSQILALCDNKQQQITPHGGLTGLVQGCNVTSSDVVLSLEKMKKIIELDPIGRTMTVEAGVPLQTLQEEAEKHGGR